MNQRLANKHAAMLQSSASTGTMWDACAQHGVYYPAVEVCSVCAPPDPPKPTKGDPVIVSVPASRNNTARRSTGKVTFVDQSIIEVDMAAVFSIHDWCGIVEPDFKHWPTQAPPPPTAMPRINGVFSGDNSKCFKCKYPNPYPADNACNHAKGWICSQCRILGDMQ